MRAALNAALDTAWEEWEIPRTLSPEQAATAGDGHAQWWAQRIARQKEIDASIAAKADTEYLYDQPYEDKSRVRVAGPFTLESLSPHRVPAVDVDNSLFDELEAAEGRRQKDAVGGGEAADFVTMVLDNLRRSGVQQAHKETAWCSRPSRCGQGAFWWRKGRRDNRPTGRTCPNAAWRSSSAPNTARSAAPT